MSSPPEFRQTGCQPMIQFMVRAALVIVLLLVAGAAAQTLATAKPIAIVLPPGTASETVQITYALEGSFGGHGDYVAAVPNVTSYEVPVAVEGKIADRVQIVTWIPRCEMRTYDVRPKAPVPTWFLLPRSG